MIDDNELQDRIQAILGADTELASLKGYSDLRRWIREQPGACFVGATAAACILGIPAPHITRLRQRELMPVPIEVEGGYPVYLRDEVEELAALLEEKRRERARKRVGAE